MQTIRSARDRIGSMSGKVTVVSTPRIAITVSNSTNVNPEVA